VESRNLSLPTTQGGKILDLNWTHTFRLPRQGKDLLIEKVVGAGGGM